MRTAEETQDDSDPSGHPEVSRRILCAVAGLGCSAVMTQLALMRELLGAFGGNELVLAVILADWLLLTGLGAWLGKWSGRLRSPERWLAGTQAAVALLPLVQVFVLRAWRNQVFTRGAEAGLPEAALTSFVLLLPYCLASGWMLTLACGILAWAKERLPGADGDTEYEGAVAIRRVYVADSLGSILGGVMFTFLLAPFFDHMALLCWPALANLLLAVWTALGFHRRRVGGLLAAIAVALIALFIVSDPDTISTRLCFQPQNVLFKGSSPYGRLVVTEQDGQLTFLENGLPVVSTQHPERAEETAHFAMAQRPSARRVLLLGGALSGAAREILKHGVENVTCVDLDPLLIDAGRRFLPKALDEARVTLAQTDPRPYVRGVTEPFDVVISDLPDPATFQINRFYTEEFFREASRALAKDGVLCFAVGHYENFVSPELAGILATAQATAHSVFSNVMVLPAGRVFFLASQGALYPDIATRLERKQVATQWVNRHYLEAALAPDRMADIRRAVEQPASLNQDFRPTLYYLHLRHWMSQFEPVPVVAVVLLAALPVLYVTRLRPAGFAVFASGFAASALEMVLLFGFQVLHGSLYRQLGVVVTVFMCGLALGARAARSVSGGLAWLAFGIAGLGGVLPWLLQGLASWSAAASHSWLPLIAIPGATFVLALLVGMEFPLASRQEGAGAAATASRLYAADFAGACLGAMLTGAWLVPVLGVPRTCWVVSALNLVGGMLVLLRRTKK